MTHFNSHKFTGDIATDNRALLAIRANEETPAQLKAEQVFDAVYAHWAKAEALPTIKHFHLFDPEIADEGHRLIVTMAVLDSIGQSKLVTAEYLFDNIDLRALIVAEGGFTHVLAILVLYQVIPLLGMCEVSETVTMSSLLQQSSWLPPAPSSGCESDPATMLLRVIRKLGTDPEVLQSIAALAWQDRMNLFRIMSEVGMPYADQANPYHAEVGLGYANNRQSYIDLSRANAGRVSVDMKWDSNSLLTGSLLNCTASKINLSNAASLRGDQATALSVDMGYQDILNEVAPLTPVPYYGTATIEALAQILNGWEASDTLYVGDQYEKHYVTAAVRKRKLEGHADNAILFMSASPVVAEPHEYTQAGYFHGRDIGHTIFGHNMLNALLAEKAQVGKRVATVLSNYPQILVDYILSVFDKKADRLVKVGRPDGLVYDETEYADIQLFASELVKNAYARIQRTDAEVSKSAEATIYYRVLEKLGDVELIRPHLREGDSVYDWLSEIEDQLLGQMSDRIMSDDICQVKLMDEYIGEFQARVAANLKAWRGVL